MGAWEGGPSPRGCDPSVLAVPVTGRMTEDGRPWGSVAWPPQSKGCEPQVAGSAEERHMGQVPRHWPNWFSWPGVQRSQMAREPLRLPEGTKQLHLLGSEYKEEVC